MIVRDAQPTPARQCAQIKQLLKCRTCQHPECAVRTIYINEQSGGGYVEFCVDCMRVLDYFTR